jgi:hypothetical protein
MWDRRCGRTLGICKRAACNSSKTDQPNVIVNFFDAHELAGKDRAETNLFVTQTGAARLFRIVGVLACSVRERG